MAREAAGSAAGEKAGDLIGTIPLSPDEELRVYHLPIAYRGFECPDAFVVGYGLDYRQYYRNLPYLALLRAEPR